MTANWNEFDRITGATKASYVFRGVELPDHLRESIDAYVNDGRPVGNFLTACFENNLRLAFAYADEVSAVAIRAVVGYLYNDCPMECWGSPERVAAWLDSKRRERSERGNCAEVGGQVSQ